MIRALNTGVMGMRQFQTSLDVIGNNLANINTVAYKGARAAFADTLSQTMRAPTPDTATTSGTAGMQVGNGMQVSAIKNTFTQGAMKNTGVHTDLAINGKGFFLVKDPTTNELFATRAGDFREDKNGYLVTNDGYRVQGKTINTFETILEDLTSKMVNTLGINREDEKIFRELMIVYKGEFFEDLQQGGRDRLRIFARLNQDTNSASLMQ